MRTHINKVLIKLQAVLLPRPSVFHVLGNEPIFNVTHAKDKHDLDHTL